MMKRIIQRPEPSIPSHIRPQLGTFKPSCHTAKSHRQRWLRWRKWCRDAPCGPMAQWLRNIVDPHWNPNSPSIGTIEVHHFPSFSRCNGSLHLLDLILQFWNPQWRQVKPGNPKANGDRSLMSSHHPHLLRQLFKDQPAWLGICDGKWMQVEWSLGILPTPIATSQPQASLPLHSTSASCRSCMEGCCLSHHHWTMARISCRVALWGTWKFHVLALMCFHHLHWCQQACQDQV